MKERSIDVFAPGVIVHPILGKRHELPSIPRVSHTSGEAYPDGKGDNVGVVLDELLSEAHD